MIEASLHENHPIWKVHDEHRTARLNIKYYCAKLKHLENYDRWIDIASAITTPSAIAGLAFWQEGYGKIIWGIVGAVTTGLAVAKPILKYSDRIKKLEDIVSDYRRIEHDLALINIEAEVKNDYDSALQARFMKILDDLKDVKRKIPESHDNVVLLKKCNEEVRNELPPSSYFVPRR